ncbi:class I SAM-dependent methyltransferase (plasmid) [Halorussus salilacus]|uniref:class I SAM-dependent methyltransferase n=1 Tax=Halorussus salilacus TaxID=2953750 RepID=UPI00209F2021|nr:class I SAM-dependent methyltransferase [Halorussus salilacus]USZ69748.1 class I SAM-dependent methyltransferase [Halorussus salilacus]
MPLNRGYQYVKAATNLVLAMLSRDSTQKKRQAELGYWRLQKAKKGKLPSDHYEYFFTDHFDLDTGEYDGKRVLDIGCGPRGSLDWATMAEQNIGLDPLVNEYENLGFADDSPMEYVDSGAEDIPFPDEHFDIVTSFNSLDHVDDLQRSIAEIKRVTAPDGLFLLITDVNHDPTVTEPISYGWDIVDEFRPEFELVWQDRREKSEDGIYASARFGDPYDFSNEETRYGVLSAKFERRSL